MELSVVIGLGCLAGGLILAAGGLMLRDVFSRRKSRLRPPVHLKLRAPYADEKPAATIVGRFRQRFCNLVRETGTDTTPWAAFLLLVMCALAFGGGLAIWQEHPAAVAGGVLLGIALPLVCLAWVRARRMKQLYEQMPEAMDVLVRAVRAGESLDQALQLAAVEVPQPLGSEFQQVVRQLDMGLSLPAAIRTLGRRVRLMEMRIFATSLSVHRQTGGNVATTLERMAKVIRDRIGYRRQFQAVTAGGRVASVLIVSISFLIVAYMAIWQPDYVGRFLTYESGWAMLSAIAGLQIIGLLWITGLLRNDY